MLDIIIVGGGPAGLSAAISARQRNNSVSVISNDKTGSGLYKAQKVDNYPGFPSITGKDLLDKLAAHSADAGSDLITGKVNTILQAGDAFHLAYDADILTSKTVILATGIVQTALFPGEEELLGHGVSYCATCDGMLFRGKRVCVACFTADAHEEADYLVSIGCDVVRLNTRDIRILGEKRVTSIIADGEEIECSGVFILRPQVAPHLLLAGLETENGYIRTSPSGATNISGVFAAGDCVGIPHQIAKAVGQGQIAALSASEYVREREKTGS